ncbi:16S rRNA processing protein RimM [Leptothrix cholodnii SP-6]|uniref:Ribosome maturation factor RimM n=1 Tax=Leptothrix cholodnii (strain ATCC 51168 / LMG 8142 / SP-6) TaxID=395495 RepID=RIMM_LEPCP|nr:ribosome maturation factor RimM [Leptothrix cholodnii]B1Y0H6.1 RecName: Full=Ribosome maturation factor RimM [Leptothrix cholodnii SP-6]ACB32957.1 16S rRNA processing protein RimM [Leptothrix cholodnii SP-6]
MAAADESSWPADVVEVAKVIDAWGVKGWFRVHPYAADAQAVFTSRRWYLQGPDNRPRPKDAPALPRLLHVTEVKEHGDGIVACAPEVADRSAAEALKGARIFVSRASFPTVGDGEYYWIDLIGLSVVNRDGESLGTVTDLIDTGPHSVLRLGYPSVDDKGAPVEGERLIPFVAAYIDSVQLDQKRIVADWGLDY